MTSASPQNAIRYRRYEARAIAFRGVREHAGWRIKQYTIACGGPIEIDAFDEAIGIALAKLPAPDVAGGRAGVGFVIAHAGDGMDYVTLGWWNRENELPLEIVVREQSAGAPWRDAVHGESVCVWDLQVISAERHAYVATVLNGDVSSAVEAYLAITASG